MIGEPHARAIQRLLDREHVRIVGRLRHQRDHRVVRLVRMMQEHVALVEHREQIGAGRPREHVDRLRAADRAARRVRAAPSAASARASRAGPGRAYTSSASTSSWPRQQLDQLRRKRRCRLRAGSRRSGAAGAVRVRPVPAACVRLRRRTPARRRGRAGCTARLQDRLTGKELRQVRADDVLEQHERRRRSPATGTSRARPGGTWTIAEPALGRRRARRRAAAARLRLSDESSGNGRDTSIASGVSTGKHRVPEERAEATACSCDPRSAIASDPTPRRGERGHQLVERQLIQRRHEQRAPAHARPRAAAPASGRRDRRRDVALGDGMLQARDADHEELVEIRRDDGGELDALEQRDWPDRRLPRGHAR